MLIGTGSHEKQIKGQDCSERQFLQHTRPAQGLSFWVSKNRRKCFFISLRCSKSPRFWHQCSPRAAFTRCLWLPAVLMSVSLTPRLKLGVAGAALAATTQGAAMTPRPPSRVPETFTCAFASPQHMRLAPACSGGARTQGRVSKTLLSPWPLASPSPQSRWPTNRRHTTEVWL